MTNGGNLIFVEKNGYTVRQVPTVYSQKEHLE